MRDQRRETTDKRQEAEGEAGQRAEAGLDKSQRDAASNKGYGYRELVVWRKGIDLAKQIYELTGEFPTEEKFGLVSQMRRAAVSVPSNIAEGQARHTTKEFIQFISHAEGSLAELDTQLVLGMELGYCSNAKWQHVAGLMEEVRKMLNGLRRNLSAKVG